MRWTGGIVHKLVGTATNDYSYGVIPTIQQRYTPVVLIL